MKSLIIALSTSVLFATEAQSQITKGNWMIGGNVSGSLTHYRSELGQNATYYSLLIMPDVGYFFTDKLVAGLKINIDRHGSKATGTSVFSNSSDYNFGPFIRYYLLPADNIVNIVAQGAYQYGFIGREKNKVTSKNTFSVATGPVVFFNSAVGLELLLNYSTCKYVSFSGSNGTITVSLGLQVYLKNMNDF